MSKKSLAVVFPCLIAACAVVLAASAPQKDPAAPGRDRATQATHLQHGLASFDQGFYEFLPKSRHAEAEAAFAVAVKELELALEPEPNNNEAHRTLGRIYTLKRDHLRAAAHYRRLTEIDPYDIDSYALAALSLAAWSLRRHRYVAVGWLWYLGTLVPAKIRAVPPPRDQRHGHRHALGPGPGRPFRARPRGHRGRLASATRPSPSTSRAASASPGTGTSRGSSASSPAPRR